MFSSKNSGELDNLSAGTTYCFSALLEIQILETTSCDSMVFSRPFYASRYSGALDTTYAATGDAAAIETAVVEFHDALNVLFKGDAGPMKTLWSHANDTTYMGPMGDFDLGWSAISSLWDEQAKLQLGGKVVAENIHVAASPSLAVAHYMERGSNFVDGKEQKVSLRTTTTFRKENGLWKVIGHHTDTLSYLE